MDNYKDSIEQKINHLAPLISCLGICGNFLLFFTILRSERLKMIASNQYLLFIAVCDSIFLIVYFYLYLSNETQDPWILADAPCIIANFFINICSTASSWSIVAITAERYRAVFHPLKASSHGSAALCQARLVIGLLTVGAILLTGWMAPFYKVTTVHDGRSHCSISPNVRRDVALAFNLLDSIFVLIFPTIAIICLNTAIVVRILKRVNRKFSCAVFRGREMIGSTVSVNVASGESTTSVGTGRTLLQTGQEYKITRTLVIITTTFVCLNLPSYVFRLRDSISLFTNKHYPRGQVDLLLNLCAHNLYFLSFATNVFVYSFSSAEFRKDLHLLVCSCPKLCWRRQDRKSVQFDHEDLKWIDDV